MILDIMQPQNDPVCKCKGIRWMKNLDQPLFKLAHIIRAIDGNAATIYSWFDRGHFSLGKKDQQAEAGGGHAVSFRTALEIAIAVELYRRCDLHPAIGAKAAREFTRIGDGERDPGELFGTNKDEFTVLVVYPGIEDAKVVRMTNKTLLSDVFWNEQYGRQIAATVLWLNSIDRDLRVALLPKDKKGAV